VPVLIEGDQRGGGGAVEIEVSYPVVFDQERAGPVDGV